MKNHPLDMVVNMPAHTQNFSKDSETTEKKRSAEESEAVFSLVSSMDMYSCGKALVCALEAKDSQSLNQDEQIIMALFADRKSKHSVNPGSAKAEYELAAELGLATKDEVACRKRYSTCPYTSDEMMGALRNSQL